MTSKLSLKALTAMIALIALAACAPSATPDGQRTVNEARATQLAQNALEALNAADYARYSQHWSAEMKEAIKEENFLAFRDAVMESLGLFVEITDVEVMSVQPGTYRYVFTVAFERGDAKLAFGFHEGSDEIQGVFAL